MEQSKKKKRLNFRNWLCIALALMFISTIGAFLVQTSGTSIKVRRFKLVVSNGYEINGQMYIPKDASSKNKLPMVVVQHGSQHNLEMQDMNMVELSRRGYIVISTDAYGHGSSTPRNVVPPTESFNNVIEVIEYVCNNLDIVDQDKIGIAGHSMGAAIVTNTLSYYVEQEAKGLGKNKIAACLEIGYDPSYTPYTFKGVANPVLADASWGVIAGKYDEFFFKQKDVNNDPAKILQSKAALDFIHQVDSSAQGPVENGKHYTGQVNGKECLRVFYRYLRPIQQRFFHQKVQQMLLISSILRWEYLTDIIK
jgi:pimeloyl-ACP methyl ester carboxylesterase